MPRNEPAVVVKLPATHVDQVQKHGICALQFKRHTLRPVEKITGVSWIVWESVHRPYLSGQGLRASRLCGNVTLRLRHSHLAATAQEKQAPVIHLAGVSLSPRRSRSFLIPCRTVAPLLFSRKCPMKAFTRRPRRINGFFDGRIIAEIHSAPVTRDLCPPLPSFFYKYYTLVP
jgi:hypothetical protein